MKILTRLLTILVFIQAPMAGADTVFNQELKQFTLELMNKGVHKVGQFNLQKFYSELDKIQWHVTDQAFSQPAVDTPGVTISVQGDGLMAYQGVRIPEEMRPYRESARYLRNQVFVGTNVIKKNYSDSRTQILLHEALGALGYNDHHSAQSSSLILINQYPSLSGSLGDAFFNSWSLKYGGSSVGGGGDLNSLDLKQKVLKEIFSKSKSVSSEFLSNYAGITFEPMDEDQNQRVMIMYEFNRKRLFSKPRFRGVRQDRNYEELVTVLFPRKSWVESSAQVKSQIIQFISFGILSIFPTSQDQMSAAPYFKVCDGNSLMVPNERSSGADLVLRFRANMIANCRPRTVPNYNKVGFEVDIPRAMLR